MSIRTLSSPGETDVSCFTIRASAMAIIGIGGGTG